MCPTWVLTAVSATNSSLAISPLDTPSSSRHAAYPSGWAGTLIAVALLVNGELPDSEFAVAFVFFMLWTVVASAIMTRRAGKARVEASSDAGGMTKGGAEAG